MRSSTRKIRVLLADDHRIVREGIRSSLAECDGITIVGEAVDGKMAIQKTRELAPDVVLMDLNMPQMNGLEATRIVASKFPKSRVIALTMHANKEYVQEILRSGAKGYVLKDTTPEQLIQAIQVVAEGDAFFSPSVSRLLLQEYSEPRTSSTDQALLSRREKEVLRLIASGKTNKEVASELSISVRTVETYRARLMRKVKARNAAELTRFALKHNLVT